MCWERLLVSSALLNGRSAGGHLFGGELLFLPVGTVSIFDRPTLGIGVDFGVGAADLTNSVLFVTGDIAGDLPGESHHFVVIHDVVDQTELESLVGGQKVPGETHFTGTAHPDGLG